MSGKTGNSKAVGNLRSVTQRLATASTKQFPQLIPQIARALPDCKPILSASEENIRKDAADAVVLHRFKTQISTLLAHRSPEGRWAAVVLIKASIDLGGYQVLSKCGPWVRGLLNILNKPDPLSTQKLCVITLTRIFALTREYATLVREVTTPSLPTFITACLNSINSPKGANSASSHLRIGFIQTILNSFCALLPNHPSIFRNFQTQLKALLGPLLAPTPTTLPPNATPDPISSDPKVLDAARSLFALLHFTAPKSGSSIEYCKSLSELTTEAHETADHIFRAVLEDWQSVAGVAATNITSDGDPSAAESSLGLPGWSGIYAGCERLCGLLTLLDKFVSTQTAAVAPIPVARVVDLLVRVCTITVPSAKESNLGSSNVRLNEQISKDEREALWSQLPAIHVAALNVMEVLCERLNNGVKSLHQTFIELIAWVFRHENYNETVKVASYEAMSTILESSGSALSKEYINQTTQLLLTSCKDILPTPIEQDEKVGLEDALNGAGVDAASKQPRQYAPSHGASIQLRAAATDLLATVLSSVSADYLPRSLRSQLDHTAILSDESSLMLASVLNPSRHHALDRAYSSILPFLARSKPGQLEVEGLLRPRMPVVQGQTDRVNGDTNEEDINNQRFDFFESSQDGDDSQVDDNLQSAVESEDITAAPDVEEAKGPDLISLPGEMPAREAISTRLRSNDSGNENNVHKPTEQPNHESKPSIDHPSQKRATPHEDMPEPDPKRQRFEQRTREGGVSDHLNDSIESSLPLKPIVVSKTAEVPSIGLDATPAEEIQSARFAVEDDGDDDDDFVIPDLTLDPDTEEEEEG